VRALIIASLLASTFAAGFDQVRYSAIIASRVGGKVGYAYQNFHGFTVHTIPDSMAAKIRGMPEVMSVVKSTLLHLD